MDRKSSTRFSLLVSVLLVVVVFAVFWPVLHADFVHYDDPIYVSTNLHVSTGLTWENIKWSLTATYGQNWFPLTWITHMLDVQFFGLKPGLHHLTNLILHCANTVLLFFLLRRLTGALWRSGFVAALFAIHPLHVESVAWVAERKDVLSGFFFMLTLLAYERYARLTSFQCSAPSAVLRSSTLNPQHSTVSAPSTIHRPSTLSHRPSTFYTLALLFFALGLMSKPMLVTLPFVLLLLDFWPLKRIGMVTTEYAEHTKEEADLTAKHAKHTKIANPQFKIPFGSFVLSRGQSVSLLRLIGEKLPFFLLTILSSVITIHVQTQAMVDPNALQLPARLQNAALAYGSYLKETIWPTHLAIFYPYPAKFPQGALILSVTILIVITGLALWQARRFPFVTVGWFWFLGMVVPTIGIVQVGAQARADRYTYLPLIGMFILVTWTITALCGHRRKIVPTDSHGSKGKTLERNFLLGLYAATVLVALGVTARQQVTHWHDSETVFRHATKVTDENYVGWGGLGIVEMRRKNPNAAITNLNLALKLAERHGAADGIKYYMGAALQMAGKGAEALPWLEQSNPLPEQRPERYYRIGLSLIEAGRLAQAETNLNAALAAQPENPEFKAALAGLLISRGETNRAERILQEVVSRHPDVFAAQRSLANLLLQRGHAADAVPHFEAASKSQTPDIRLLQSYAEALAEAGRTKDSFTPMEQAVRLAPKDPMLHYKLAQMYSDAGRIAPAIALYDRAISLDPKMLGSLNDLAWILATDQHSEFRNGTRAVALARSACEQSQWNVAFFIGTLAAAYAEAGEFPEAIQKAEKAIVVARANHQEEIAKRNLELLALYKSGKPYRDPSSDPDSKK